MKATEFSVLGPLMGGFGSQAFLGCLHAEDGLIKPAVMVFLGDEIVDNLDLFRRVWTETELGAQIDHVNVIGVMGLARLDEGIARVVEYADAESLRSVYRRATTLKRPVPPRIACTIVADAAMGVHYAHELGLMETGEPLIHGGIRPDTLQVSFKGMGKVTGYGATTIAEVARKNRNDNGRDAYTAPEQAYGGRAAATAQTDVYSLGCVLYEALTGKTPFAADNDLAEAMIRDELARPSHQGISEAMAAVVLKATRKKSAERYASAFDLRQDLLEHCEHASEVEIRQFMDELFPPDTVPRATRDQMLIAAREKPPAPTGRLLVEMPLELGRPTRERGATPGDADVAAAQGRPVQPPPSLTAPVTDPHTTPTLKPQAATSAPPPMFTGHELPEVTENIRQQRLLAAERAQQRAAVPAPPPLAGPPSWHAPSTTPPLPLSPSLSPSLPPALPPPSTPPSAALYAPPQPVVYRNSPALLVALGALGAVAAGAFYVAVLQKPAPAPPPPPVVVPAVEAPPPVPAPPVPAPSSSSSTTTAPTSPEPPPDEPPPRPVKKTGPGKLVITANPPSMVISVDGKTVGTGTASWEGKAGPHKVVARDAALRATAVRVVNVKPGETSNIQMAPQKGSLTFDQLAPGLDVFVDGKRIGTTPMPAIQLYSGPHKIVVKKGGAAVNINATIVADRELFITADFQ